MLWCAFDHIEHLIEKPERDVVVEQVAHLVYKVRRRFATHQWLRQTLRQDAEIEAVFITPCAHGLQPFRHDLGVAVLAAGRNFRAACGWVPRLLCPFDCRFTRHVSPLFARPIKVYRP